MQEEDIDVSSRKTLVNKRYQKLKKGEKGEERQRSLQHCGVKNMKMRPLSHAWVSILGVDA